MTERQKYRVRFRIGPPGGGIDLERVPHLLSEITLPASGSGVRLISRPGQKLSREETLLEAALDEESAAAILGDLTELHERDRIGLSPAQAMKRRRERARNVWLLFLGGLWRHAFRRIFLSMEITLYWGAAIAIYLLYWQLTFSPG